MSITGAVLFAAIFGIFGVGASLQIGLIRRLHECSCKCGGGGVPQASGRQRVSTAVEIKQATRSVACSTFFAVRGGSFI